MLTKIQIKNLLCLNAQIYTKAVPNIYEGVEIAQHVYECVKIVQNVYESVKIEIVQDAVGLVDWRDGAAEGRLRACEQESIPFSILVLFSPELVLLETVLVLLTQYWLF